ncbi:MAG: hypothetical protein NVS1B4_14930 [Gemmatimonadaceae bacterium]
MDVFIRVVSPHASGIRIALALGVVAVAAWARVALAQGGGSTDILTGRITGPDGQPIAGAAVEVTSLESQITRRHLSNGDGHYTVVFPDGGGQYRLSVRYIGFLPVIRTVARQADEDRLVTDIALSSAPTRLADVVVRAAPQREALDRPTPGATERVLSPDQLARLPIDASDLAAFATLVPGVVGISATDSTAAAFSIAGQRPTANTTTLDGVTFGAGNVPQNAIRVARVITNSYDVSRGQFSGGLIATTTRSGTNLPQGSFTYSRRDPGLSWQTAEPTTPYGNGGTQNQWGGGLGGPLVRDRLFLFGAVQGNLRDDRFPSLAVADVGTLLRLGVTPDSVQRFLEAARSVGVQPTVPRVSDERSTDNASALARLDYLASDMHTLTIRGDGRFTRSDPSRIGPLSLAQTGAITESSGGGVMGVLTSRFGSSYVNEFRAYMAAEHHRASGFVTLPTARVVVASDLAGGTRSVAALGFGGNAGVPQRSDTRMLEVTNELSWLPGGGRHRVKLGALLNGTQLRQDATTNRYGTFVYNSIRDLSTGAPASYTRTLTTNEREATTLNVAGYLGDSWRNGGALQVIYGVRVEGSRFIGALRYNRVVDSLFSVRTDYIPAELHASPRIGFTFTADRPASGPPRLTVRGGAGEFRSPAPGSLYGAVQSGSASAAGDAQLICIGAGVPVPDWLAYRADPSTIPAACATGGPGLGRQGTPTVTVFDPAFSAPRVWRGSLGVTRRILDRVAINAEASYALGVSQYGFRDLNLDATPKFRLAYEGNRPVYVPPQAIATATGALSSTASRIHPELGQVLAVASDLRSSTGQLTLSFNGITTRGATVNMAYTLMRARDQSSFGNGGSAFGFAAPTTAGDPNVREWARSDFERRHQLLGTITFPVTPAVELTSIARLTSGQPYTPLVGSDINGDGSRNDRAFIFDPRTTTDTAVAAAMTRLLASASGPVRSCLGRQIGTVVSRNSCTTGWQPALDLQLNFRPSAFGLDRRLTLSLLTVNLLAGVDRALHGGDGLHGWGQVQIPDQTLLYVKGFDPTRDSYAYTYAVNGRFGSPRTAGNGMLVPFQIAVQARYAIGRDPARDRLRAAFPPAAPGAGGAADFRVRFEQLLPNPVREILDLRGALELTDAQVATLTAAADTLSAGTAQLAEALRIEVEKAGANPDPSVIFAAVRPRLQQGRAQVDAALAVAKRTLTAEQWAKVPPALQSPRGPGFGRRRPSEP